LAADGDRILPASVLLQKVRERRPRIDEGGRRCDGLREFLDRGGMIAAVAPQKSQKVVGARESRLQRQHVPIGCAGGLDVP
jgi:hypothetical protein